LAAVPVPVEVAPPAPVDVAPVSPNMERAPSVPAAIPVGVPVSSEPEARQVAPVRPGMMDAFFPPFFRRATAVPAPMYEREMIHLREMGFGAEDGVLLALLREHKGDVARVALAL